MRPTHRRPILIMVTLACLGVAAPRALGQYEKYGWGYADTLIDMKEGLCASTFPYSSGPYVEGSGEASYHPDWTFSWAALQVGRTCTGGYRWAGAGDPPGKTVTYSGQIQATAHASAARADLKQEARGRGEGGSQVTVTWDDAEGFPTARGNVLAATAEVRLDDAGDPLSGDDEEHTNWVPFSLEVTFLRDSQIQITLAGGAAARRDVKYGSHSGPCEGSGSATASGWASY